MKRLIKKSEIFDGINWNTNDYYEVFKNPSSKEIEDTYKDSKNTGVRGIMCYNGDIYIWPCSLLHDSVLWATKAPDEMHFAYEYNTMTVFLKPGEDAQKLIDTMRACKSYLDKIGVKGSDRLQIDYTCYKAKKFQFYDFVDCVDDIYNVTDGEMKMIV